MSAGVKVTKRVFSGIQPTGVPQLGNYLGTIKNWVSLQQEKDTELFYSIVDLHALTVPRDPKQLRRETTEMAAALIACGIDPKRSVLFRQSAVAAHSQLHWVLGSITPVGWLNRMTQWKSKLHQQNAESEDAGSDEELQLNVHSSAAQGLLTGLFTYPVLMAADILLYRATHVPVGEDQVQHLELARDLAVHFNKTFKTKRFSPPTGMLTATKRVMSLKDPLRKMSKSDPNEQSRITLSDTDDQIVKKIKKAPTDAITGISFDPKARPGVSNLLSIYAAMKDVDAQVAAVEMREMSNAQMKEMVAQAVVEGVAPIRQRMRELMDDPAYLDNVLRDNEDRARETAEKSWQEIAQRVGLVCR
ncbi:Tryptophan--tRNA ligase, mitochondrial [Kickxella alabastrina]|uniref:Tryptophan--tRNA ligase, mitochondrial n=1 Tax=Kickxella alabastrina TaxID=61397 RepID=A0ACC1I683_9FUNG|nr:Tryptophan--tRNA ligase, mitochondrial [Kickxella alabastrina]